MSEMIQSDDGETSVDNDDRYYFALSFFFHCILSDSIFVARRKTDRVAALDNPSLQVGRALFDGLSPADVYAVNKVDCSLFFRPSLPIKKRIVKSRTRNICAMSEPLSE